MEFGAVVELKEGRHFIKGVYMGVSAEFAYEVKAGETNNALIVRFDENRLDARHNPELPF